MSSVFSNHFDFSLDDAIQALDYISPNIDYLNWSNIGRAGASEFGEDFYDAFDAWSSRGDSYNEKQVRNQWKSFKRTNKVNISTLIYHAKQGGWNPEKKQPLSADVIQQRQKERDERKAIRDEKAARITNLKLRRAERFYNNLQRFTAQQKPTPYQQGKNLEDAAQFSEFKHFHSTGPRRNRHVLMIPLRDVDGNFQGGELIYAWRKSRDNKTGKLRHFKRAFTGTQPQLGFHVFPNHEALATAKRVFITEGWADGVWAHKADGDVSAYVVGCHNIPTIARQIKNKYPDIQVIAAVDNDKAGREVAFNSQLPWTMPLQNGDDWSDVATQQGVGSLRDQLNKVRGWDMVTVNEQYLGNAAQANIVPGLNLIRSAKETGKSTNILKFMNDNPELSVLVVSYRKNLVNQLASKAGVDYYEDLITVDRFNNYSNVELRKSRRLAISPDSIYKLVKEGTVNPYDVIFVDECDQTLMHFDADTMNKKETNFGVMSYLLTKAKYQIMADADLSDLTLSYCNAINLNTGKFLVNDFKPRLGSDMHLYKCAAQLRDQMLQRIKHEPVFYCSNSKSRVLEMEQLLMARGVKSHQLQAVHSSNSSTAEIQQFMADINNQVKGLHVLLASPSLGTGISIDKGHQFNAVFAEFTHRSGTAEQAHQQMARVRGVSEYHVFVDPTFNNFETDAEELMRVMMEKPELDTHNLFNFDIEKGEMVCKNLPFETHICKVKAIQNENRNAFAVRFLEQADQEGYTIHEVPEDGIIARAMKEEVKQIKKELKDDLYSRLIDHEQHPVLSDEDFQAAQLGSLPVSEESRIKTQVVKSLGLERALQLPSLINREKLLDFVAELALKEISSRFVTGIKNLSVCAQDADVALLRDIEDRKYAESRATLRHFTARRRHELRFLKAVGIDENLEYNGKVFEPAKISAGLRDYIKRNKDEIMAYSRSNITANTLKNPVRWLMDHLRSIGVPMNKKQVRENGELVWKYSVNKQEWSEVTRLVNLRVKGITRYYSKKRDDLNKVVTLKVIETPDQVLPETCNMGALDYIDTNCAHVTPLQSAIPSTAPLTAQFEKREEAQTPAPQFDNNFDAFIHQQAGPDATHPEKRKLAEKFTETMQARFNSGEIAEGELMQWMNYGTSGTFRTAMFNVARVVSAKVPDVIKHKVVDICMNRVTGQQAADYCSGKLTREKIAQIIIDDPVMKISCALVEYSMALKLAGCK